MNVLKKWHKHFLKLSVIAFLLAGVSLSLGEKPPLAAPPSFRRMEIKREGVVKNLYLDQEGEKLHSHISCKNSLLHINPFIETMEQVEAVLHYKDETRHLLAGRGTYDYKAQTFRSASVNFSFYKESSTPFLEGIAEQVTLLIDKTPHFKAEKIEAQVTLE